MQHLPPDFAEDLAHVLEPSDLEEAAAVIAAAAAGLDDERLGTFLALIAQRVRESAAPITRGELQGFLKASKRSRRTRGV